MSRVARALLFLCASLALVQCQTITEEPVENPSEPTLPTVTVPIVVTPIPASTPVPGGTPTPAPGATPTPAPEATPTPNPTPPPPPVTANCTPGGGSGGGSQCQKSSPLYVDVMGAAIDDVVAQNPQMFNTNDKKDAKAYKVLDPVGYQNKVAQRLRQMGYCASVDNYEEIGIKENNNLAESYDIITSSNYIWRGFGSYQITCWPPWF